MSITDHQHIIGRLATWLVRSPTGTRPSYRRRVSRVAIGVAAAAAMAATVCVAAPHAHATHQPDANGLRDDAAASHAGFVMRAAASSADMQHDGLTESGRRVRDRAAHAAARAKARYPYKPTASSDTAKALGMTDAELTSWLTDIRQQAASPILRPPRQGDAELHPTRSVRPTDS